MSIGHVAGGAVAGSGRRCQLGHLGGVFLHHSRLRSVRRKHNAVTLDELLTGFAFSLRRTVVPDPPADSTRMTDDGTV